MTDILKDVIKRGTGRKAQVPNVEVAGKTGTTNRNVDAWFCGYSPAREVIVWFGRDNNRPIGKNATGGVVAAPAFAYFFKRLYALRPDLPREFIVPDGVYILWMEFQQNYIQIYPHYRQKMRYQLLKSLQICFNLFKIKYLINI